MWPKRLPQRISLVVSGCVLLLSLWGTSAATATASPAATRAHDGKSMALMQKAHVVRARLGKSGPLATRTNAPGTKRGPGAGAVGRPTTAPAMRLLQQTAPHSSSAPRFNGGGIVTGGFQTVGAPGATPPDSALAVSPNYLVSATNQGVAFFDKNGDPPANAPIFQNTLSAFFAPAGADAKEARVFDPRVVYDEYLDRFWVLVTAENDSPDQSSYLLALSPQTEVAFQAGTWTYLALEVNDAGYWCDYPQLGVDAQAIYLTCNMFDHPISSNNFEYAHIDVYTKLQFLGGACCTGWRFFDLHDDFGSDSFTIAPAHMHGASAGNGEYLVNAEGQGGGDNELHVRQIYNVQNCCTPGNQSAPSMDDSDQTVGSFGTPPAGRQPNNVQGVDTGDTRVLSAVWLNGNLYLTQNTSCSTGACALFTQLNVSDIGNISTVNDTVLSFSGNDTYYPSIEVNAQGSVAEVFGQSSTTAAPGSNVVIMPPANVCTNCYVGQGTLTSGGATYVRLDTTNRNRWGDYFAAAADPDGTGIWVQGESTGAAINTNVTNAGLVLEPFDNVPPSTSIQLFGTPHGGWYNTSVGFEIQAVDSGVGVRSISFSEGGAQTLASQKYFSSTVFQIPGITAEGTTQITYTATDDWGNVSSCTGGCPATVQIDKTPPSVTCDFPDTQWHATDVQIFCQATDRLSGLADPLQSIFYLSTSVPAGTETATAQTNSEQVCDVAGNCATAGPVGPIMVDKKPPTITVTTPASGAAYTLNSVVPANYACQDGGSGVATCVGTVANGAAINTATAGTQTFTVTATDQVGNVSTPLVVSYAVAYGISLQYNPARSVYSGAIYPILVELVDANGVNVSSATIPVTATGIVDSTGKVVQTFSMPIPFKSNLGTSMYVLPLSTTGLSNGSYSLTFIAGADPTTHYAPFTVGLPLSMGPQF
ncbi:MAG TPA: hypothetical protein VKQ30_02220 [Ktedonobacterales bacterium]|nr:hypothetical protein [Ktedonobacterales bacterium]